MSFKRESRIYILLLIPAFLLGGFIHVAFYGVDFFDGICQIYYSCLAIIWGISIRNRIIDKKIRGSLMATAGLMLMIFTLQLCRYKLLGDDNAAMRYAWYGYYIPVLFSTALLYRTALLIGTKGHGRTENRPILIAVVISGLLSLLIMTNDFHQLVFKFPDGVDEGYFSYDYAVGFYLNYVWVALLFIISLIIVMKKCRVYAVKKKFFIPLAMALIGSVGEILIIVGLIKYNGINIWQTGEFFFFWVVGFEEACISIGLIPANIGYKKLLDYTSKPIVIEDVDGEIVYKSPKALEALENTTESQGNVLTFKNEISGGTVSWAVDMSVVFELNREIAEATEQIESRNEYLHTENDLKVEQSKINARNELYDNMAHILSPQIRKIKELLETSGDSEFDKNLQEISVLNAYIKRRSNMELLCNDSDFLPLKELNTAINESCEYIKLCGAQTMVAPVPEIDLPAKMIILAYDFFESIVESTVNSLKSLFVTTTCSKGRMTLRLLINANQFELRVENHKDAINEFEGDVSVTKEDSDTVITLSLKYGGDEV